MDGLKVRACPFCKARGITEHNGVYVCPYCLQEFEYDSRVLSMGFLCLKSGDYEGAKKQFMLESGGEAAFGRFLAQFKINLNADLGTSFNPIIYSYNTESFSNSDYYLDALRLNEGNLSILDKLQTIENVRLNEPIGNCDIFIEKASCADSLADSLSKSHIVSRDNSISNLRWARSYIAVIDSVQTADKIVSQRNLYNFSNLNNADAVQVKKAVVFCLSGVRCVSVANLKAYAEVITVENLEDIDISLLNLPRARAANFSAAKLEVKTATDFIPYQITPMQSQNADLELCKNHIACGNFSAATRSLRALEKSGYKVSQLYLNLIYAYVGSQDLFTPEALAKQDEETIKYFEKSLTAAKDVNEATEIAKTCLAISDKLISVKKLKLAAALISCALTYNLDVKAEACKCLNNIDYAAHQADIVIDSLMPCLTVADYLAAKERRAFSLAYAKNYAQVDFSYINYFDCKQDAVNALSRAFKFILNLNCHAQCDSLFTELINMRIANEGVAAADAIVLADKMLLSGDFSLAGKYYQYCLERDKNCYGAYLGLLKVKHSCVSNLQLTESGEDITLDSYYISAVTAAHNSGDKKFMLECANLAKLQQGVIIKNSHIFRADDFTVEGGKIISYNGDSKNIYLPPHITEIGEGAFFGKKIESLIISDNVTKIGDSAFAFCGNLAFTYLPDKVKVDEDAFYGCSKLGKKLIDNSADWVCVTKNSTNNMAIAGTQSGVYSTKKLVYSYQKSLDGGMLISGNKVVFGSENKLIKANADNLIKGKLNSYDMTEVNLHGVVAGTSCILSGYIFTPISEGSAISVVSPKGNIVKTYHLERALTRAITAFDNKIYCICDSMVYVIDIFGGAQCFELKENILSTASADISLGKCAFVATARGIYKLSDEANLIYKLDGLTVGKNTISKIVRDRLVINGGSLYFIECKSSGYYLTSYNGSIISLPLSKTLFKQVISQPIFVGGKCLLCANGEIYSVNANSEITHLYTTAEFNEAAAIGGSVAVSEVGGTASRARLRCLYKDYAILSDNATGDFYIIDCKS